MLVDVRHTSPEAETSADHPLNGRCMRRSILSSIRAVRPDGFRSATAPSATIIQIGLVKERMATMLCMPRLEREHLALRIGVPG